MILIKMPMPQSCYLCPFMNGEYLVCDVPGRTRDEPVSKYRTKRHEDCPLMDFGEYMQDPVTKLLQEYRERMKESDTY